MKFPTKISLLITILALMLPLFPPAPIRSQDAITVTGALTALQPEADVIVRVTADAPVTITLSSPDFDAVLTVLDSVGARVAFNDDHPAEVALPNSQDAALTFTPSFDALMTVRVASYQRTGAGAYTLSLDGAEFIEQTPISILQNASGAIVQGVLAAEPEQAPRLAYGFRALAGAEVLITLTSEDFDPVLDLYTAEGAFIVSNDDHGDAATLPSRTDSAVVFQAPEDGIYAAVVRSFEDAGAGAFTLGIEGAVFAETQSVPDGLTADDGPTCDNVLGGVAAVSSVFGGAFAAENLLDSDAATGWSSRSSDAAPYLIFEVHGGAPRLISSVVLNGFAASEGYATDSVQVFEVGVAVDLLPPEDFEIVLQGTAPLENAPQFYTLPAPVEARYVLLRPLTNYGGGYFQAADFNACTTSGERRLRGDPPYTVRGQLPPDAANLEYRLYAGENAAMTATLTSSSFDPVIEVYAADGRWLADNDDHDADFDLPNLWDAGLALDLPNPGEVVVRVRSLAGGGPFTLVIDGVGLQAEAPPAPTLPPCRDVSSAAAGGSVIGFSSEFGGRWLAAYLIDGLADRGWASAPGAESARTEYVIVDLAGDVQTVTGFRINPAATGGDGTAYNVSRFAVLVSTAELAADAEPDVIPPLDSFTEVFSTLLEERYRYTLAFSLPEPVAARYVLLETRDTFGGRWHEVAEFTVCAVRED